MSGRISGWEHVSSGVMTSGQGLSVKKMRDRSVLRQESFHQRVLMHGMVSPESLLQGRWWKCLNWKYHKYQDPLEKEL